MKDLPVLRSASLDQTRVAATSRLSRRGFLLGTSAVGGLALAAASRGGAQGTITTTAQFAKLASYGGDTLPTGVHPRLVPNVNGLTVNMLEAGTQGQPLVLLIHGFPNLGYSWRKVMRALAGAGHYVVAPDCRGFGRTVGWDNSWDADPTPFLTMNMVRDQIALVYALGYRKTAEPSAMPGLSPVLPPVMEKA